MHATWCVVTHVYIFCAHVYFYILFTAGLTQPLTPVGPTQPPTPVGPTKPPIHPKPQQPTQVVPSQLKGSKHRYPIAANGKLLDIAVIGEEKPQPQLKSPKVNLRQRVRLPDSDSEDEIQELPVPATPHKGELGKKDWGLPVLPGLQCFICVKCSLKHNDPFDPLPDESLWVFCPVCKVVIHTTCILNGCVCKFKPRRKQIS